MAEFRILLPNLEAAQTLKQYMLSIGEAHLLVNGVGDGYPARVRIPVPTAQYAVQVYPLIRAYSTERQVMQLERLILGARFALPIPALDAKTAMVGDLVGLHRYARNVLKRADVMTVAELLRRYTTDLEDIPGLGASKRKQHLIDCVHAHGFKFADEK